MCSKVGLKTGQGRMETLIATSASTTKYFIQGASAWCREFCPSVNPSNDGAEIEVVVSSNSRTGESQGFESFIEEKLYERFGVDN